MKKTTFTCTHIYTFVQNICVIAVYFGSNAFLIAHKIVWKMVNKKMGKMYI